MTLPDDQTDYWNRLGPAKIFAHPINFDRLDRWLKPAGRVLDFGCGYGRALGELSARGYRNLMGFDTASAMIAAARETQPHISFQVLEDFRSVPLPDESVDAVLLMAVLTCVPDDDCQRAIIAELSRILAPGGLLYISDMWLQTDARNRERYAAGTKKYGVYGVFDLPEGVTVRHHERGWIDTLTRNYEVLALDDVHVQTMNGNPAAAFQWFGRKLPADHPYS